MSVARVTMLLMAVVVLAACGAPTASKPATGTAAPAAEAAAPFDPLREWRRERAPGDPRPGEGPGGPNIVIFLIDTLRRDHVGCYGYPQPTTPHLDAFAEDAVLFWNVMPQSSWTRPSVASLFTGAYPSVHGAQDKFDRVRPMPTLADALRKRGYHSEGFCANPNCLPPWNIGGDFDRYVDVCLGEGPADDVRVVDEAIAALDEAPQPWFFYLHTIGPHRPYEPPAEYAARFMPERFVGTRAQIRIQRALARYDGEIAHTDAQFGRFIAALEERGLYDDAIVIVLSDHGEQFMEHGACGHGRSLYNEELEVPFLFKLPGARYGGEHRSALLEMVSVAPTILDLAGAPPEPSFQGRSFRAVCAGDRYVAQPAFACLQLDGRSLRAAQNRVAKYLYDAVADASSWFDFTEDSHEYHPRRAVFEGAEELRPWADRMALQGAAGFHLLIAAPPGTESWIEGLIVGHGGEGAELVCAGAEGRLERTAEGLAFRVHLGALDADQRALAAQQGEARLYTAHLTLPRVERPAVKLVRNTAPAPASLVRAGRGGVSVALDGTPLDPALLEADPGHGDVGTFPEEEAIYVWQAPPVSQWLENELPEGMRDAMEALGYLE